MFYIFTNHVQAVDFKGSWLDVALTDSEETQLALTINQVKNEYFVKIGFQNIGVSGWPAQSVIKVKDKLKVTFLSDSGTQEM